MEWIEKRHLSSHQSNGDVIITDLCDCEKHKRCCIKFHNTSYSKITTNGLIAFATEHNRMYFREGSAKGFKLTGFDKHNTSCHIYITKSYIENCEAHFGAYKLQYDVKEKLWYIDYTKKLEE